MFLQFVSTDRTLEPGAADIAMANNEADTAAALGYPVLENLEIDISGHIDRALFDRINRQLLENPHAKKITLKVNSYGGRLFSAVDIHILIRRHRAPSKIAILEGNCCSGALLIAVAADLRIAKAGTEICMHPARLIADRGDEFTSDDLQRFTGDLRSSTADYVRVISYRAGADEEVIARECSTEDYSSLEWCLQHGIIHQVMEQSHAD